MAAPFLRAMELDFEAPERDIKFVVDQFLPNGYLTILAGDPKCGKTSFATTLAFSVALGLPFLDREVTQGSVIWLSLEEGFPERRALFHHLPPEIRKKVNSNPCPGLHPGALPIYNLFEFPPIDTEEGLNYLAEIINAHRPQLVVIDSLHASHSGRSLADGWAARKTLRYIKRLSGGSYPAILVLHHLAGNRKHRRVAESAQLSAVASMSWIIEQIPGPRTPRTYTLTLRGRGSFANQMMSLKSELPLQYSVLAEDEEFASTQSFIEDKVIALIAESPKTVSELIGQIHAAPGSIKNAVSRMLKLGRVEQCGVVKKAHLYRQAWQNKGDLCDLCDLCDSSEPEVATE